MKNSFRETIQFYLLDSKTPLGKMIDIFIILLNLFICAILVVETYNLSDGTRHILEVIENVIVFFFILEYMARLYGAENRFRQLKDVYSIIDLIAILPTLSLVIFPLFGITFNIRFIKLIRIFRIFRIFRFLRFTADPDFFFGSITIHFLKVIRLFLVIFMLFFIWAGLFWYVEHGETGSMVSTFGDSFYFTVATLTTVGYGDIIPVTELGRWVTVFMIMSGIVFIPWQVSQIVKEWIHLGSKTDVICQGCGLRYHDKDASHCKSCGHVIYQVFED